MPQQSTKGHRGKDPNLQTMPPVSSQEQREDVHREPLGLSSL
jgi:hypothetical protein